MKKIMMLLLLCVPAFSANAAWFDMPTICRASGSRCYPTMGAGFDIGMWDAGAKCFGMKVVCAAAMRDKNIYDAAPLGKRDLTIATDSDFDLTKLNGACFGVRRSIDNGLRVMVDGNYSRVWCRGVLPNPDENVDNGEIAFGAAPSCSELADSGYAGVVNGDCYGKRYAQNDWFIECGASDAPSRLVKLNGARNFETGDFAPSYPTTQSAANAVFERMME